MHSDSVKILNSKVKTTIDCLKLCSTAKSVKSGHRILCNGLYSQVRMPCFLLLCKFSSEFVEAVNIASNTYSLLDVLKEYRMSHEY